MSSVVVVGSQWGDEGKGKIVDYLAEKADYIVRYSGGANAGHTVVTSQGEFKLQLLPSGILHEDKVSILGNGVVIDPASILVEIDNINKRGINTDNFKISDRAHVLLPYHKKLDELEEIAKGDNKIGTTKHGIGPCYMDKMARVGIRMCDLLDKEVFAQKLKTNIEAKNKVLTEVYHSEPCDYDEILKTYLGYAERLRSHVTDTSYMLALANEQNKKIMYEGAQATFLDIDHGTYPFVTSSNPTAGGVCAGAGVGPRTIGAVVGVVKAYSTRVGEGPFVTELHDETGSYLRETGYEYGTVTKRPRRCGWLDVVAIKYAARINGLDYLAITRLDILDGLDKIKICVGYKYNEEKIDYIPASLNILGKCTPIYEELDGWKISLSGIRKYEDLPENARKYVEKIKEVSGVPISMVSVGANREETIVLEKLFD